jgi:hypothetical protein
MKSCPHTTRDEVRSADGSRVWGRRCRICGAVFGIGKCASCNRQRDLVVTSPTGELLCSAACLHEYQVQKKKLADKLRDYCPHVRREDVTNQDGDVIGSRCLDCLKGLKPGRQP